MADNPWTDSEDEEEWGDEEAVEYEESAGHSMRLQQAGRCVIGPNEEDESESVRFGVDFTTSFPDGMVPKIFCQVEGQSGTSYGDVFGCTVVEATESGFQVNVGRGGDCRTWGQHLTLAWVALVAYDDTTLIVEELEVGSSDEKMMIVHYEFPQRLPRGQRPICFATCVGDDYPDSFSVTLQRVSSKRASFVVNRLVGDDWGQNLRLNILATTVNVLPAMVHEFGPAESSQHMVDLDYGFHAHRPPICLTMLQHQSGSDYPDAFLTCTTNMRRNACQVNVMRMDCDEGWGQNLRVQMILFP